MKKYRCSVCKVELSTEEVNNYLSNQEGLDFNWGQCQGEEAHIEEFDNANATDKELSQEECDALSYNGDDDMSDDERAGICGQ